MDGRRGKNDKTKLISSFRGTKRRKRRRKRKKKKREKNIPSNKTFLRQTNE